MVCNWHDYYSTILEGIKKNHPNRNSKPGLPDYEGVPRFKRSGQLPLYFSAVFSWFVNAYHTFVNPQLHANNTSLLVCMLVYRSISYLPVRISQSARRLELRWTTMCEPLMHISSTQNKQDVLFEKLPSRGIPLEGTMHLKLIQVAIMRLNFLIPSRHKQNVSFRAHRHVICT